MNKPDVNMDRKRVGAATRSQSLRAGVLLIGVLLAGCTPSPFADDRSASIRSALGSPEPARDDLTGRLTLGPGQGQEEDVPEIDASAGVELYVQLALERNPSLVAARQRVRRLLERVPQVTSLDDPMLQITPIGDMAETAAGQVRVMSSFSQRLPFPGKLATRGRIAERQAAQARQDLDRVGLEVAVDTRRSYWSLWFAARAIEVTRRNRGLLQQLREVAESSYRAGRVTQQDVLRASVEVGNLDNELVDLAQRFASARAMLNRLIDRPVQMEVPDPPAIDPEQIDLRLDDLLRVADATNPAIMALREQLSAFRERRRLANLDRWPDLTLSVGYNVVDDTGLSRVANGDDQWWIGFGINLPIYRERLDAAEREATRGVLETAGQIAAERNRVAFRVQDALARVESQQQQVSLLGRSIIPEARQAVEASLSGYRGGDVDFLTLIDNWRKLLTFELMYHQRVSELERSFAELQEAVGRDLERAPQTPKQPGKPDEEADS